MRTAPSLPGSCAVRCLHYAGVGARPDPHAPPQPPRRSRAWGRVEFLLKQTFKTGPSEPLPDVETLCGEVCCAWRIYEGQSSLVLRLRNRHDRKPDSAGGARAERSGGCADGYRSPLAPFARLSSIESPIPPPLLWKLFSSTTAHAIKPAATGIQMTLPVILIASTLLAHAAGPFVAPLLRDWADATRVGLAAMFCWTATTHFNGMRDDMVRMVRPMTPNPAFLVTLTGVCEALGTIDLLVPRTRRVAAVALIPLLLSVLPANINAAIAGVTFRGAPLVPPFLSILLSLSLTPVVW